MGILGLGTQELVVIVVMITLLFGASAIPKVARSLGRVQGEFKKAKKEFAAEVEKAEREETSRPAEMAQPSKDNGSEEKRVEQTGPVGR